MMRRFPFRALLRPALTHFGAGIAAPLAQYTSSPSFIYRSEFTTPKPTSRLQHASVLLVATEESKLMRPSTLEVLQYAPRLAATEQVCSEGEEKPTKYSLSVVVASVLALFAVATAPISECAPKRRHPRAYPGTIFGLDERSFDEKSLRVVAKYLNADNVIIVCEKSEVSKVSGPSARRRRRCTRAAIDTKSFSFSFFRDYLTQES